MSQRSLRPQGADSNVDKQRLSRLLNEALDLTDALELPPEIGARLQEVIDMTQTSLDGGGPLH